MKLFLKDIIDRKLLIYVILLLIGSLGLSNLGSAGVGLIVVYTLFLNHVLLRSKLFPLLFAFIFFGDYSLAVRLYFLASLLSTVGLNISVLRALSSDSEQREENSKSLSSALIMGMIISVPVSVIIYFSSGAIFSLFKSSYSGSGLSVLALSLPFFTINKILLASLNAYRRFAFYSLYQALRPLFILVLVCFILFVLETSGDALFYCFLLSEALLLVLLLISVFAYQKMKFGLDSSWFKKHLSFGTKSFASSAVSDLHNSIDVIILGILGTSYMVGVYNYAADIAKPFSCFL